MKRFYHIYQYIAPLIMFPLACIVWRHRYPGNTPLIILTLALPIVFSYIMPNLGSNVFQLWEFNTRFKMKNIRPHHGFLFGSATSLLLWLSTTPASDELNFWVICRSGFVVGSVLAFWNWLYDLHAIKSGFLQVYNYAYHQKRSAEDIAAAYAPIFFWIFGFCYGAGARVNEYLLFEHPRWSCFALLFVIEMIMIHLLPTAGYMLYSYVTTGASGLISYKQIDKDL